MFDVESGMSQAMAELGINPDSLDEGSDLEIETESKEATGEIKEEEVDADPISNEDSEETEQALDGEEVADSLEAEKPSEEAPVETEKAQEIETAKQNLEVEKKAFYDEKLKLEKDFQEKYSEKLKAHDDLDTFLGFVADKNPDLFEEFKSAYQEHREKNAMLDQFREETNTLRAELEQFKAKASDQVTITKLEAELNQVKSTLGKEAEEIGLKIDWEKVTEKWATMPGSDIAFIAYGMYGANIAKAAASKAKVEAVTKKVSARPTVSTVGSVQKSNAPASGLREGASAFDAVNYFAKQLKRT
jgi:hypothetical protein